MGSCQEASQCEELVVMGLQTTWELPKIGDPNIVA